MGTFSVYKDTPRIKGTKIIVGLKTSDNPTLFHDVIAAEKIKVVGSAIPGKANTDEPVTGLILESLHAGVMSNFRVSDYAFGGLLGGLVVVAVVDPVLPVIGIDIGGLTC